MNQCIAPASPYSMYLKVVVHILFIWPLDVSLFCYIAFLVPYNNCGFPPKWESSFHIDTGRKASPTLGVVCTVGQPHLSWRPLSSEWEESSIVQILSSKWTTMPWSGTSVNGLWKAQSSGRRTWRRARFGTRCPRTRSSGWFWSSGSHSSSSPSSTATFVNNVSSKAARGCSIVLRQGRYLQSSVFDN